MKQSDAQGTSADRVALFGALQAEYSWLYRKWQTFRRLYAADQATIDVLNDVAPWFFRIIYQVMLDDIALALSRLTERSKVMRKATLVLDRLVEQCDPVKETRLRRELDMRITLVKGQVRKLRYLRNARLAHTDSDVTLRPDLHPLPTTSRDEIEPVIEAIGVVLNVAAPHFGACPTAYEPGIEARSVESVLGRLSQHPQR